MVIVIEEYFGKDKVVNMYNSWIAIEFKWNINKWKFGSKKRWIKLNLK